MLLLCFWDAWRWYLARVGPAPEEALALGAVIGLVAVMGSLRFSRERKLHELPLGALSALLVLYAASHFVAPPIARAAIAVTAVLLAIHWAAFGSRPSAAFWALVALALPVVPTLQFYLGYPMRLVSASATVALLQANGLAVSKQGTALLWQGEMIQFDAPCSGVTMLWAGLFLATMVCFFNRLGAMKLALALLVAAVFTLAANILRASSLFYLEAGLFDAPGAWLHEGVGVAAFALSAAAILIVLHRLGEWNRQ